MKKHQPHKIYWIHPHFYNWMGGHKYIYEVIIRLQKEYDLDITVITAGLGKEAAQKFSAANIPTLFLFGWSTNSPIYWIFLPLFLWAEKAYLLYVKKIDRTAVFVSSMYPSNALATSLSTKTVQLCYEPFAFFYDKNFTSGFSPVQQIFIAVLKTLYAASDDQAVKKQKTVLTISQHNQKWISEIHGVASNVIYEGVDLEFFKPTTNAALSKKYKNKVLVFHSTDYTLIKGTSHLLKAWPAVIAKIPRAHLVISETLPNSPAKKDILKMVKELGLEKQVEFAGFLPYKLLPAYLSLAQVVVQPSIQQSMNLTVKEAMACNTPIITSLEGHEQTKDGQAGFLIDPYQTNTLSKKIITILSKPSVAQRMAKKGRHIIIKKFSWESVTAGFWRSLQPYLYD